MTIPDILHELAEYQREHGFESDTEFIELYLDHPRDSGWRTPFELLVSLRCDVWWHYGQVGEEDERHIYVAMEARINQVIEQIRKET